MRQLRGLANFLGVMLLVLSGNFRIGSCAANHLVSPCASRSDTAKPSHSDRPSLVDGQCPIRMDRLVGTVKRQCAELQPFPYCRRMQCLAVAAADVTIGFPGSRQSRTNQESAMSEPFPAHRIVDSRRPAGFVEGNRGILNRDVRPQRWEKREGMPFTGTA